MELSTLTRARRALSAAVSVSAVALVMAKVSGPGAGRDGVGSVASIGFIVSALLLLLVWRREHAENQAAFAARERQQLALLKMQAELAKSKREGRERAP